MYVHPDDEPQVMDMFLEAIAERKTTGKVAFRMQHADGHYLWMESVGDFLFDDEGEVKGAGLFTRNITDRKNLEEELSAANRDLLLNIEERKRGEGPCAPRRHTGIFSNSTWPGFLPDLRSGLEFLHLHGLQ